MGIVSLRTMKNWSAMSLKFLADLMIRDRTTFDQLKRETKRCLELTHSWQAISSN
jgi:hypothetical protein